MKHVCCVLGVTERRACRVLGQPRSTQRHRVGVCEGEARLVARIVELARAYGRYGYRRITALLHREGWRVNHKKVERAVGRLLGAWSWGGMAGPDHRQADGAR